METSEIVTQLKRRNNDYYCTTSTFKCLHNIFFKRQKLRMVLQWKATRALCICCTGDSYILSTVWLYKGLYTGRKAIEITSNFITYRIKWGLDFVSISFRLLRDFWNTKNRLHNQWWRNQKYDKQFYFFGFYAKTKTK